MTQAIQCLTYVTENAGIVAVIIRCFMNKINKFINGIIGWYSISGNILFWS